MNDERDKILKEYKSLCMNTKKNKIDFEKISEDEAFLCQFILNPTNLNLPERVRMADPLLANVSKCLEITVIKWISY